MQRSERPPILIVSGEGTPARQAEASRAVSLDEVAGTWAAMEEDVKLGLVTEFAAKTQIREMQGLIR